MPLLRTNRALLDRFRAGAPEALATVYWEYVRKVERLLNEGFGTRDHRTILVGVVRRPADLADLVQEVFVRAFSDRSRRAYDGLRDYGPYLYAIARNVLADWVRSRTRETPVSDTTLETMSEALGSLEEVPPWADPWTMRVVEAYVTTLPYELRRLHTLRHEDGLSQEQAAEQMGVSRQTIRTLEGHLRGGLAARLTEAGISIDSQPRVTAIRTDDGKARQDGPATK